MAEHNVALPSKPRVISEEGSLGIFEIDGFHPGYGHTLGNSLRRIILSSLPGAAITSVSIDGVPHEFETVEGVKEDVIEILLNLKKVRFRLSTEEPQMVRLKVSGIKTVTAADIEVPGQVEVLNPDQHIAELTDAKASLDIEMHVEQGLGYISKEVLQKERVDIGSIALDAVFSPIRRVNYEVENMRVGDRTDFNRLRVTIETDGTLSPKEALERSIEIMILQLKAVVGFREEEPLKEEDDATAAELKGDAPAGHAKEEELDKEFLKTRIDTLDLSTRTVNALTEANIRTVGGLVRKREDDILAIEGLGQKGIQEIKRALSNFGITLKS